VKQILFAVEDAANVLCLGFWIAIFHLPLTKREIGGNAE
jgi:hypothetical protein